MGTELLWSDQVPELLFTRQTEVLTEHPTAVVAELRAKTLKIGKQLQAFANDVLREVGECSLHLVHAKLLGNLGALSEQPIQCELQ